MPDIIKPIGRICATDKHGYFLNDSDAAPIQSPFLEAVQDAVRWYRGYFGERLHSLYIRGTVARGVAIAETSDLKHYPEQRPEMKRALELAIQPASDAETVTDFLTSFGSWMAFEIKKSHRGRQPL